MKQLALYIAVVGFFFLAVLCWLSELSPMVCALRALGGAATIYLIVRLAGRLAVGILVDAVMKSSSSSAIRENADEGRS